MTIDVLVQPIAMVWAGLDQHSLESLLQPNSYVALGAPTAVRERSEMTWDADLDYPEDLTTAHLAAAVAAANQFQDLLRDITGSSVAWSESLPPAGDLDAWEEAEDMVGQLAPGGLDEMRGIAAALDASVEPGSLERLFNAWSDETLERVWREGGGSYPNILALGIETILVPAPLPRPLVGPAHNIGSSPGLRQELDRFARGAFGLRLDQLVTDPPFAGGLRDEILHNLMVLAEALEQAESRQLPIVVSG